MSFLVAVAGAAVASAADPSPAAKLASIQMEAKVAQDQLYKALEKLEDTKEGRRKYQELFTAHEVEQVKRYEAALELAKADPKSDTAFAATEWLLTTGRVYHLPVGKPVLEFARAHFATDRRIGKSVLNVGQCDHGGLFPNYKPLMAFLNVVLEKNRDRAVRAQAGINLAWGEKWKLDEAEYRHEKNVTELATAAEKAFEKLLAEYGECKLLGRLETVTVGERAKLELYELKHLRVGKVAPDIVGEDLDGVKFKLSDYRGKVVLLTFWGDW